MSFKSVRGVTAEGPAAQPHPAASGDLLRTQLATYRTALADERTYAAWIRTGLAAIGFGVGAKALLRGILPPWLGSAAATLMILFSVGCFIAAIWRRLWPPDEIDSSLEALLMPLRVVLCINACLMGVALSALLGTWFWDV